MSKKIALVTGANKGIGLETVRQLASQHGFTVLLGARDEGRGKEAERKLRDEGLDVHFLKLDVANESSRKAAVKTVVEKFGKLDVLINNAGIMVSGDKKPSETSIDALRETFETNYFALVAVTQEFLPLLRKSDAGRIVNLSSQLGSLELNSKGMNGDFKLAGYNASKSAVNMYTVLLASELASTPIKVNAAHPGWVKTDMGSSAAPMEIPDGAKTSVRLATLPADGPTGGFFHMDKKMPW